MTSLVFSESMLFQTHFLGVRVLVTGGFGFLGSHLALTLARYGARVTLLDIRSGEHEPSLINAGDNREKFDIVEGDLSDKSFVRGLVRALAPAYIFNMAAYSVIEKAAAQPYETMQTNTLGWVNLLEAVRTSPFTPRAMLLASTDKVYGDLSGEAYHEDTPFRCKGIYDTTKLAADLFSRAFSTAYRLPIVTVRMCNMFGPGDFNTGYRLVPKAMKSLFASPDPIAPELYRSSLDHWRDYLYVDDTIRAILLLSVNQQCLGEAYNLAGVDNVSTRAMLEKIVALAADVEQGIDPSRAEAIRHNGIAITDTHNSAVVHIPRQHLDGTRLTQATGFLPRMSLDRGLLRTILAYRNYYRVERTLENPEALYPWLRGSAQAASTVQYRN